MGTLPPSSLRRMREDQISCLTLSPHPKVPCRGEGAAAHQAIAQMEKSLWEPWGLYPRRRA